MCRDLVSVVRAHTANVRRAYTCRLSQISLAQANTLAVLSDIWGNAFTASHAKKG